MQQSEGISAAGRSRGQRSAMLANLLGQTSQFIILGPMMMLYANDVLQMAPTKIAAILSLAPFVAIATLPWLGRIRKIGKVRTFVMGGTTRALVTTVILLLPAKFLSFPLYLGLLMVYSMATQVATLTVWQPLLRGITTNADRGTFFSRMRFSFTAVNTVACGCIAFFIGHTITEHQYKILLAIGVMGLLNQLFWVRGIPEVAEVGEDDDDPPPTRREALRRFVARARQAPVLRLPLLITLLMTATLMPMYLLYLRTMLHVSSSMVSLFIFSATLGGAISFLIWGKVADAIGFRPMLIGLLSMAMVLAPVQLFLLPLTPDATWATLLPREIVTIALLYATGFLSGAVQAGVGIATTATQHFHVRRQQSMEAMTLFSMAVQVTTAVVSLGGGLLLERIAQPAGVHLFLGGQAEIDWFKFYMVGVIPLLRLVAIILIPRLPNARPYFGVSDFFSSIFTDPVRTIVASRRVYHEDEERRAELARWLGNRVNPIGIEPLLELLEDPSYDVKVEAIRSLGRTKSPLAGDRLLDILQNEEKQHLADHVAWALGELRHAPAYDVLALRLNPGYPVRVRAMAARALGKLGDPRALPLLAEVLRQEPDSRHVVSSSCRAILRLDGREHAALIFTCLATMEHRDERYELMAALCDWLPVPSRWLLRSNADARIADALLEDVERHGNAWQAARTPIITALRARDAGAIHALYSRTLNTEPSASPTKPTLEALEACTAALPTWRLPHILEAAWLLYVPPPPAT